MTNSKNTKRALFSSAVALLLCFSMLLGTTFAWFTDSAATANNVIVAGNLDIEVQYTLDGTTWADLDGADDLFEKDLWEPGHTEVVALKIENVGTLALKYAANMNIVNETVGKNKENGDIKLSDILQVSTLTVEDAGVDPVLGMNIGEMTLKKAFESENAIAWGAPVSFKNGSILEKDMQLFAESTHYVLVKVDMPEEVGNEANHNGTDVPDITFGVNVLATQYTYEEDTFGNKYDENAEYPVDITWDGTSDTTWYNDTDTEFVLNSAEQLAGLAKLVNDGNTFAGKTILLASDADLYMMGPGGEPVTFEPIGNKATFEGTFDGQGHTINNLYQSGWALGYDWDHYGSLGLFGDVNNATIKNVTISGAENFVEGGDVSFIAGSATGTCVFENITIKDSVIGTYNNGCGGIIGWSGAGDYTFKNITLGSDVVLGGLWGSFDSSIGGIVGQAEPGATYNFENVDIACRIDAYNDVTASYDYYNYRMCGMIIGRLAETTTIDSSNYPDVTKYDINCTNVNVTYGEWADYHYCRAAGARGKRVEAGYEYGGIAADYDHSVCTVHHLESIPFDQIFGGDQFGVKGLKTYDGVNVVYNYTVNP